MIEHETNGRPSVEIRKHEKWIHYTGEKNLVILLCYGRTEAERITKYYAKVK